MVLGLSKHEHGRCHADLFYLFVGLVLHFRLETVELVLRSHIGDEVIGRWPVRLEGGVPELLSDAKPTPTWW